MCFNYWAKLFKAKIVLAQFSCDRIYDRTINSLWFMHSLARYLNYGLKHLWFNVKTLILFIFAKCHITAYKSNSDGVALSCSS